MTEALISRKREYVPKTVVALALHWLVNQRTRPLVKFTLRGFSRCQAGRQKMTKHSDEIWKEASLGVYAVSLLFCDSLFEASLGVRRVSFWST